MVSESTWFQQAGFPVLGSLIALPLFAMTLSWLARSARQAFAIGIIGAGIELGLAGWLIVHLEPDTGKLQFVEHLPITSFLSYNVGVDGINILFVALTALLTLLIVLYGEIVHERPAGIYVASVFAFQAVLMGLFLSIDLLQFWLVSALELIPVSFILGRWGLSSGKTLALMRYLQDIGGGLALMLAGILILGWRHAESTGQWTFGIRDLLSSPLESGQQALVFVLMLFGLAPRFVLFPFHPWLPIVAAYGPLATVCVFLVGAKVGIYALLRFVLPLLPNAANDWKSFVVGLSITGIFYGALMAIMQINLRRLLAFAAVSHTGMLTIGVFCLNREGIQGSLLLSITFGISAAGLLFVTGVVYRCTQTSLIPRLGGMFDPLPLFGLTFLLAALSTMAMPGTPGFDAAHLMMEGAIESHHWGVAVAMASGSVASAGFLLWAFQRTFLAQRREHALHTSRIQLSIPEIILAGAICAVLLGIGFYSEPWMQLIDGSVTKLADSLESRTAH